MRRSVMVSVILGILSAAAGRADEPATEGAPAESQPNVVPPPDTTPESAAPPPPPKAAPAPSAVQSVAPDLAEAILGVRVEDSTGKDIGRLVDVLVDASGQPQAGVIDFGGFMGVGNRKVAVHWSALHFNPGDPKHKVTLDMTPDQIKDAPQFLDPSKAASVVTPTDAAPASPPTSPLPPASPSASPSASPPASPSPSASP